jgi:uncharacterized membrane protein YqaE (UPF0057 family)
VRYFWAVVLPPVAVLLCRKPIQFLLNILLTLCFVIPGMLHAILIVHSYESDKRNQALIRAMQTSRAG